MSLSTDGMFVFESEEKKQEKPTVSMFYDDEGKMLNIKEKNGNTYAIQKYNHGENFYYVKSTSADIYNKHYPYRSDTDFSFERCTERCFDMFLKYLSTNNEEVYYKAAQREFIDG